MLKRASQSTNAALLRLVLPVILIWGGNFAVMRVGVNEVGPYCLAVMRFLIASVPMVFFVRRPAVPFTFIVAYSLTFGLGQFGPLFLGIKLGLPSGMASLLVQLQVVFTPILVFFVLGQGVPAATVTAIIISLIGLGTIIFSSTGSGAGSVPVLLGAAAAFSWGASNVVVAWGSARGYRYNPVALVIWASSLLPAPFLVLALLTGEADGITFHGVLPALFPAVYLGLIATVVAYHFWVKALSMFPATSVAPFSLLIPIIGLLLGHMIFGETPTTSEALGSFLVVGGVIIHMAGLRIQALRLRQVTR